MAARLSQAEKDELKDIYDLYDPEMKGRIPQDDYCTIIRGMGHNPSQKELKEMFEDTRPDRNGMIELNDFLDAYANHFSTKKNEEREIREAFRVFDRKEHGVLDPGELQKIVTTKGEILSDSEAKLLIKDAQLDSNGKIDYEEFAKILKV